MKHGHYYKDVSHLDTIDVYAVCELFGVDDPSGATQHAVKKLLCSGIRGVKGVEKDLTEAVDTINRRLNMIKCEPCEVPLQEVVSFKGLEDAYDDPEGIQGFDVWDATGLIDDNIREGPTNEHLNFQNHNDEYYEE